MHIHSNNKSNADRMTTMLIIILMPEDLEIVQGCDFETSIEGGIDKAVAAAKKAQVSQGQNALKGIIYRSYIGSLLKGC